MLIEKDPHVHRIAALHGRLLKFLGHQFSGMPDRRLAGLAFVASYFIGFDAGRADFGQVGIDSCIQIIGVAKGRDAPMNADTASASGWAGIKLFRESNIMGLEMV